MTKRLNYKEILPSIKAIVLDVDGVLTDGIILLDPDSEMVRNSYVRDSLAIRLAIQKGLKVFIISAGSSQKVKERYLGLGVHEVEMKAFAKFPVLQKVLERNNISMEETLYMGDDLPDFECLSNVGLACCPKDAVHEIRSIVDYISTNKGGQGCVRDIIEQVMRCQNIWPDLTQNPRISFD